VPWFDIGSAMKIQLGARLTIAIVLGLLSPFPFYYSFSQCTQVDFASPASACLAQDITLVPSGAYTSFEWDFCPGDLNQTPASALFLNSAGYNHKVDVVEQNGSYFGFFLSRANAKLYRLDFGSNPAGTPAPVDLGGLGLNSSTWRNIEIVNEGGTFYGFIIDVNNLYRVSFGSSLGQQPSPAALIYSGDPLKSTIDLVAIHDQSAKYLFAANLGDNGIARIKFPNSFADPVNPADVNEIIVTGSSIFGGVSFIKECDTWFAVTTSVANGVVSTIQFDNGLDDPNPIITNLPALGLPVVPLAGVELVQDNGHFYAFTQSQGAPFVFYRIDFGPSMLAPTPVGTNLGNIGLTDVWAFSMHRFKSEWMVFSVENSGSKIFRISFPSLCFSNQKTSVLQAPLIQTATAGSFSIELKATDPSGNISYKSRAITIQNNQAPDINFSSQNVCANNNVNFAALNSSANLQAFHWNFGDGGTSLIAAPAHIFASAGTYATSLTVDASNGCSNTVQKSLQIFDQPIADFTLPSTNPVCTNQSYQLINGSTYDPGSNPTWEWRLNGALSSTQPNYSASFNSTAPQELRLKAIIPGCESEMVRNISSVIAGPSVSFTANDNCQGTSVPFTNTTAGVVDAGYSWNFGDATGSTLINPTHAYGTSGNFSATLTASNSAGCQNFQTKTVRIYSLPQPNFSVGLPPFSCANSLTSFQNTTPGLTDSNVTSWTWQFGDPASGTSTQLNPLYTYLVPGTFTVRLTAGTSAGCSASIIKPTVISPSPTADFTVGPSCLNQSTKFTDISSGGVQTRLWIIGSNTFGVPNPSYTFVTTGNFAATLTVTGANGCTSVKNRTVNVPVPPVQTFSFSVPCERGNSIFTDTTPAAVDGVVGWNWNFDGNSVSGNPSSYIFPVQGTYNVKMTTTHASGCKYTLSKNVVVNPAPIAAFTATPASGPAPLTVQFDNTSTQATSYSWKFYDKVIATSTHVSPVYTFTALGDYSAELTASNAQGCSDVLKTPIHVVVPNVDLILTDFTLVHDGVTGKLKPRVTISNNSNIPFMLAEINLFLSGNAVVNETVTMNLSPGQSVSQTLSFTLSPDQFDLQYLCAEINSDKDIQKDNNRRCINFSDGDYFFAPYPNPSAGATHIDWVSTAAGFAKVSVFDSMGKKAYEWKTPSHAGLNQVVLDLEFLTSGFYYVIVETTFSRKTSRFVRQ
jgi:PKD repeat protein